MRKTLIVLTVAVTALALLVTIWFGLANAQPSSAQMSHTGMLVAQGQMAPGPMGQQMQRQMAQMDASIKALRAQLDKVSPDRLSDDQRAMYEYLRILQTHLESMHASMGTMQGMMMQMPGMMGR